ncbi:MAG: hypothetical protein EOM54_10475 [Clostridia bacterium]|nr:hypothetical protein [Clostridia bacterium]NCC68938.1 hypothetical protein [Clostridia bacterium]
MNIINFTPNPSGGYPPIQTWSGSTPPEGYAEVVCDIDKFQEFRGFVTLTVEDGGVTGFAGNQTALDTYLAEYPDLEKPEPKATDTEVLDILLGVGE